ncbi:unnamed protein product, partial [Sphenostylis stenocarpa]
MQQRIDGDMVDTSPGHPIHLKKKVKREDIKKQVERILSLRSNASHDPKSPSNYPSPSLPVIECRDIAPHCVVVWM